MFNNLEFLIIKIISLLLHSIEVIVQDTKIIDGLSVDDILFFKMATMKKIKYTLNVCVMANSEEDMKVIMEKVNECVV